MSYDEYCSWPSATTTRQHHNFAESWDAGAKLEPRQADAPKVSERTLNVWTSHTLVAARPRVVPRAGNVASQNDAELWVELARLAATWRKETMITSSAQRIVLNESYQRIIGYGLRALPFILEQLRVNSEMWFPALRAITGDDPVDIKDRGNMRAMRDAWLEWARSNNLIAE